MHNLIQVRRPALQWHGQKVAKKKRKEKKSGIFVIKIEYVNRKQKGAKRNVVTKLENIQKSKT